MTPQVKAIIVFVCMVVLISHVMNGFIKKAEEDKERKRVDDMREAARLAAEAARLQREREEIIRNTAAMQKAQKDLNKDYISDAEVISETKYLS